MIIIAINLVTLSLALFVRYLLRRQPADAPGWQSIRPEPHHWSHLAVSGAIVGSSVAACGVALTLRRPQTIADVIILALALLPGILSAPYAFAQVRFILRLKRQDVRWNDEIISFTKRNERIERPLKTVRNIGYDSIGGVDLRFHDGMKLTIERLPYHRFEALTDTIKAAR